MSGSAGSSGKTASVRRRKKRDGVVVSDRMNKTVVVEVVRLVKHATYGKYVKRSRRFYAHAESGTCKTGDRVRIVETKPLSRLKRWRVERVLAAANSVGAS